MTVQLEKRNDVSPKCPHCQDALTRVWFRELESRLGRRYVYFCPACRAVLGVSHRKGFFMG